MILTQDQAAAVVRTLADLQNVKGSVERLNFAKTGGRATLHYSESSAHKLYVRQSGASITVAEEWYRDIDLFRQAYRV